MAALSVEPALLDSKAAGAVRAEAGNIAAIDGLRGLSVTWILLFHFVVLRPSDPWAAALRDTPLLGAAIAQGPLAVDLFFLISGFLLTLPWLVRARDGRPAPSARAFYMRRVRRIVPAYYVHLALLFGGVMPLLFGATYWRHDLYVYAANAIAHAVFVHNLSPLTSASMGVNGALWTLAVEAQFYLVLPALAPVFARAPWRTLAVAAALSAAWSWGTQHGFEALVRWHLAIGGRWSWDEEAIRRFLGMQLPAYAFVFALGAMLGRTWLLRRPGRTCRVATVAFEHGPLAFMGRVSYSAYLWHLPLLLLLQARTSLSPAVFFPAYVATVAAVGWTSWRFIERPFMRASGPARESRPPAP